MTRVTKYFAVDLVRDAAHTPAWPRDSEAGYPEFEGNADYNDLRPVNVEEARRAIAADKHYLERFVRGEDLPRRPLGDDDHDDFDDDVETLIQRALDVLDPGVAGAVASLAAAGCAPFNSCNGGAFGDPHSSPYPTVHLFVPFDLVSKLMDCSERASVGFEISENGRVEIFAQRIENMMMFAEIVVETIGGRAA